MNKGDASGFLFIHVVVECVHVDFFSVFVHEGACTGNDSNKRDTAEKKRFYFIRQTLKVDLLQHFILI